MSEMSEVKEVLSGAVVWFDSCKGFGFINQDSSDEDIFVHWSNIDVEGYKTIKPNQTVNYELGENHHGVQAVNVVVTGELEEPLEE